VTVELEGTADILANLTRPARLLTVGFALEAGGADGGIERARAKLREKHLDYIVLNDALEPGAGFEVATNRVTIIGSQGEPHALPLLSKRDVADRILDAVERTLT
jgi:phosphopantothenoylcysteine decarboxylase/phosphopantothenate--cysteine ligase